MEEEMKRLMGFASFDSTQVRFFCFSLYFIIYLFFPCRECLNFRYCTLYVTEFFVLANMLVYIQGKHVEGAAVSAALIKKKRKYRQVCIIRGIHSTLLACLISVYYHSIVLYLLVLYHYIILPWYSTCVSTYQYIILRCLFYYGIHIILFPTQYSLHST